MKRRIGKQEIRYEQVFWVFMAGSVMGFILEGLWCVVRKGAWEHHAATVWGPLCLVYGVGAAAIYLMAMHSCGQSVGWQFYTCALAGTAVEYLTSLAQELFFGSRSWDYSGHYIHINGRVSLRMSLTWGLLGVAFIRLAAPCLRRCLSRMQGPRWHSACVALSCWMVVNLLVTGAALGRWRERIAGKAPGNAVEATLDRRFPDPRMESLFPNMAFTPLQ